MDIETSNFINTLLRDINLKKSEYKNVVEFIKSKNLVQYKIDKFNEENLPAYFYTNTSYLIRNRGIISIYPTIASYPKDIRFSIPVEDVWECTVSFYNVTSAELNGMDVSEDMVSYNTEHTAKFVLALLKSGFSLYYTFV